MLGDLIESALNEIGVTKEAVEAWVGAPCGCEERKEKLNQISYWAKRVISGKIDRAREFVYGIIGVSIEDRKRDDY